MKLKREKVSPLDRGKTTCQVVSVGVGMTTSYVTTGMFTRVAMGLGMAASPVGVAAVAVSSIAIGSMAGYYTAMYTQRELEELRLLLLDIVVEKDIDIEELKSFN